MKQKKIFIHMAAEAYHIILNDVEKVKNRNLNLFSHSPLHINTNVLTNYVDKMVEL